MITFTYADNSETVSKALGAFHAALADYAPALAAITDDFREMVARQFASEGRAEGTPWPPRKTSDVGAGSHGRPRAEGRRRGLPLLVRTGALRDSLIEPNAAGHVEEIDGPSLSLGTSLPYAIFHQTGTRRMPARPIIVLSDERSERWQEIVRSALEEKTLLLSAKELAG